MAIFPSLKKGGGMKNAWKPQKQCAPSSRGGQGPKALQGTQDPGPTEALHLGPKWEYAPPPFFGKKLI